MYNLVLAGFKTKEQVEEFLSWYGNQGEQDFGLYLDHQDFDYNFVSVNYYYIPTWVNDNYVAHVNIYPTGE